MLHVNPGLIPFKEIGSTDSSIQEVAKQYLSLHQKLQQLIGEKQTLERILQDHFAKEGLDEISVSSFVLKKEGGGLEVKRERGPCSFDPST